MATVGSVCMANMSAVIFTVMLLAYMLLVIYRIDNRYGMIFVFLEVLLRFPG
jgi:hypothetical protein